MHQNWSKRKALNHHSINRDKDKEIFKEKIAYNLLIQIDNPKLLNLNIIQDNVAINRVVPPSLSLVLASRITKIIPNKVQANCTIKGGPQRKMVYWILTAHYF